VSQENVELIRRSAEAFSARDLDSYISEFIAPDVEWHTAAEDPDAATHHGQEEFRRYVERWKDSFEDLQAELVECLDTDDDRVFTWVRWTGRGRTSAVGADWHLAIVYTVEDRQIIGGQEYFDRREALESVGL